MLISLSEKFYLDGKLPNFLIVIQYFQLVPKDNVAVPAANDLPILQDEWGNDGYYDEYTGNKINWLWISAKTYNNLQKPIIST